MGIRDDEYQISGEIELDEVFYESVSLSTTKENKKRGEEVKNKLKLL